MTRTKFNENSIYSQVFSFEVLDYFDSIATEENYNWIEKYFDILMKDENINAEKFEIHHIRPCCTFKDKEHRTRKQTLPLANKFDGNLIKLSVYNHIFAHFYLWKIFNSRDSKEAFQRMCGEKINTDIFTENELRIIARLKEECAKKNQTEDERKNLDKQWRKDNKEKLLKKRKEYYENNKEEILEKIKDQYKNNRDEILKQKKERYKNNKEEILEKSKQYRENNKDEIAKRKKNYYEKNKEEISKKNKKRYENNKENILKRNKNYYENNKEEILKKNKEYRENNKEKIAKLNKEYCKENKEKISKRNKCYYENNKDELLKKNKEYRKENKEKLLKKEKEKNSLLCYDPIEKDYPTYGALKGRKSKNKEKYKDVILKDCIIQPQPQS